VYNVQEAARGSQGDHPAARAWREKHLDSGKNILAQRRKGAKFAKDGEKNLTTKNAKYSKYENFL
jgi:hypothetical protein